MTMMAAQNETAQRTSEAPAARWRRGPAVAVVVLLVLGVELVLGRSFRGERGSLAGAPG